MHRVQRMNPVLGPPNCLVCRRGNTPDAPDTLEEFWALDLERDVNWGDPAYVCKYCCERIAREAGHVDAEIVHELQETVRAKNIAIHDLEARIDLLRRRTQRIIGGDKARAEAAAEVDA